MRHKIGNIKVVKASVKKVSMVLWVIFLAFNSVHAQEKVDRVKADSLIKEWQYEISLPQRLKVAKELAWFYRASEMDTALYFADQGLQLSKILNSKKDESDLLRNKGLIYRNFSYLTISKDYILEALSRAKKINYLEGEAYAYDMLGVYFLDKKEFDIALTNFNKGLEIWEKLNNNDGKAYAHRHFNWTYRELGNYDKALYHSNKAIGLRKLEKNGSNIHRDFYDLAIVLMHAGNYEQSKTYFSKAIETAGEVGYYIIFPEYYSDFAQLLILAGNRDSAAYYAEASSKLAHEFNKLKYALKSDEFLYSFYKEENNFERANYFLDKYLKTKNALFSQRNSKKVLEEEMHYEFNKDQKLAELTKRNIQIGLLAILIIGSIIAFVINLSRQRLTRSNEQLKMSNRQIEVQTTEISLQANKLEEMNRLKNKLFSIISHDIRSPMVLTSAMLTQLKNEHISEQQFKKILPDIVNHLKNTSSLLNNLLFWARGQMSGNYLNKSHFNLTTLLQANVDYILSFAKGKGIQITCILNPEIMVYADKSLLDIVCRNLLANSIKFCRQGDGIKISADQIDGEVKVIISDTGVGISSEKIETIFEGKFYSETGTSKETGWGLGLMLCKEFVENNGGEIWVDSQFNKGTTFYFTIPASEIEIGSKNVLTHIETGF